jgi:lipopolysaccharide transport system permease protein
VPDDWRSFVWYLAVDNIKRQYARTRLGPLWIVLTQFVTIFGIGLVFYSIFNKPLDQFLLFISASILAWNLISVSITTAPMTLVGQASLIQSFRLPYAIFPLQNLLNSLVVFLHGLAVHVLLLLLLGGSFRTLPLLIVSLLVVSAILYPTIAVLSILGSRFRDLAPLIGSLMYLVFLITPIIWDRPNLGGHLHWIVDFNPFYHMIEIIRRPMLGTLPPLDSVLVTLGMAIVAMTGGEWFYRRYARPIPFWV